MSCALNAAEAQVQMAISLLLTEADVTISIPQALRRLRGAITNLDKLRSEAPQRRVLDQQIEIGQLPESSAPLDLGCDMAPATSWSKK